LAAEEQEPQALNDDELFDLIGTAGAGTGVAEDEGLPPQSPVISPPMRSEGLTSVIAPPA
jgi:hypothetical protein